MHIVRCFPQPSLRKLFVASPAPLSLSLPLCDVCRPHCTSWVREAQFGSSITLRSFTFLQHAETS